VETSRIRRERRTGASEKSESRRRAGPRRKIRMKVRSKYLNDIYLFDIVIVFHGSLDIFSNLHINKTS
jgi:hypothetical protein